MMLNGINPHRAVAPDHPLFALELRRVRWVDSSAGLWRATWRWLWLSIAATFAAWIALQLAFYDGSYRYFINGSEGLIVLFFGSLAANLVFDGLMLRASIGSISGELDAGRWDLLRLTLLNEHSILGAKYAIARLRSWRAWAVVSGLRVGVIAVLLFQIGIVPLFYSGGYYSSVFYSLPTSLAARPLNTLLWLGVVVVLMIFFVIEPLARLRMTTAFGIWLSTWTRGGAGGWLLALLALFGVWLGQAGFVSAAFLLIAWAGEEVSYSLGGYHPNRTAAIVLISVLLSIAAFLGICHLFGGWSLRRAVRRLPHVGG
jgi:hypothetical protein